jgi:hypothetical protein
MPALGQSNVVFKQFGSGASGILKRTFRSRHFKQSFDKLASPSNSQADFRLSVLVNLTFPPSRDSFAIGGTALERKVWTRDLQDVARVSLRTRLFTSPCSRRFDTISKKMSRGAKQVDGVKILEEGHVLFFYRSKVEVEEPHSLDDIQRLILVMRPSGGSDVGPQGAEAIKSEEDEEEIRKKKASVTNRLLDRSLVFSCLFKLAQVI